jgi:hypothetical protein
MRYAASVEASAAMRAALFRRCQSPFYLLSGDAFAAARYVLPRQRAQRGVRSAARKGSASVS